jgi:hypothetical protein
VTAAVQVAASGTIPAAPALAGQALILAAGAALAVPVLTRRRAAPAVVPAATAG